MTYDALELLAIDGICFDGRFDELLHPAQRLIGLAEGIEVRLLSENGHASHLLLILSRQRRLLATR